ASAPATLPATAFAPVVVPQPSPSPVPVQSSAAPWFVQLRPTIAPSQSPTPTPPPGPRHRVRRGDTLWDIARWHRVELSTVLHWNPGVTADSLEVGRVILVPGGQAMPKATPKPTPRPTVRPAAKQTTPVRNRRTTHVWPLAVRGVVTTRFSSAHPGIDISAPGGTAVRAIAAGTVVFAGWKNNGGGYVVVLRHPDGMRSTYNHNQSVTVAVGARVVAGQRIARLGSTGRSTGPHLDLRIEMGGRFVNPLRLY
ncbi:MAG TPA: peptidoglycan DD-metalloendopeptidase family protein, partial [Propionicimonas sp.]